MHRINAKQQMDEQPCIHASLVLFERCHLQLFRDYSMLHSIIKPINHKNCHCSTGLLCQHVQEPQGSSKENHPNLRHRFLQHSQREKTLRQGAPKKYFAYHQHSCHFKKNTACTIPDCLSQNNYIALMSSLHLRSASIQLASA